MSQKGLDLKQLDKQLDGIQVLINAIPGATNLEWDVMGERPFRLLVTPEEFKSTFRDFPIRYSKLETGNYHITALTEKVKIVTVMSKEKFWEFREEREEEKINESA